MFHNLNNWVLKSIPVGTSVRNNNWSALKPIFSDNFTKLSLSFFEPNVVSKYPLNI